MTLVVTTNRAIAAITLAATLGVAAGCSDHDAGQLAVPGSSKAAKLTQCVRPTAFMRRNHFELIKHQRDITVHQGVRATSDSLSACIACHVQYDKSSKPVPVNADGQFCDRCHDWLAVEPDCFECHSTVPQGPQSSNLNKQWPAVFGPMPVKPVAPAVKLVAKPPAVIKVTPVMAPTPVAPVVTPTPAVTIAPVTPAQPVATPIAPAVAPATPVTPQTPPPGGK